MKENVMVTILVMIIAFGVVPATTSAQMGEPRSDRGPGGGMGPGPIHDEEIDEVDIGSGYRFRYGKDAPAASVETENERLGISIDMESLTFKNSTEELEVDLSECQWSVQNLEDNGQLEVSYFAECNWLKDGEPSNKNSKINIRYRYLKDDEGEKVDYSLEIDGIPGKGEMTAVLRSGSSKQEGSHCAWNRDQQKEGYNYMYMDEMGKSISQITIHESADYETTNGSMETNITVEEGMVDEDITLSVSTQAPIEANTLSFSGSLSILDGFREILTETADEAVNLVMDHLYSFTIGAIVLTIITIILIAGLSRKKVITDGADLDIENNRYFKKK